MATMKSNDCQGTDLLENKNLTMQTMMVCPFCLPFAEQIWVVNLNMVKTSRLEKLVDVNKEFYFALVQCQHCSSIDLDGLISCTAFEVIRQRFALWIHSVSGLLRKIPKMEICRANDCVIVWGPRPVFKEIDFEQPILRRKVDTPIEALSFPWNFTMEVVSKDDLEKFFGIQ
jgi:hypothetical protein